MPKESIYRDVGLYIVATLTTLAFAIVGELTWYSSVIFLCIYLLLVIIVYIQDKMESKDEK